MVAIFFLRASLAHRPHCCSEALFDFYDADADGQLSATELEGASATLAQMLGDSCHQLRAATAPPALCFALSSTDAERWGYAFLTCVILMLFSFSGIVELLMSERCVFPFRFIACVLV